MRKSVNRPPTPDVMENPGKEPTLQELINIELIESGEKERLMELLRERLIECGWKDEMKALCSLHSRFHKSGASAKNSHISRISSSLMRHANCDNSRNMMMKPLLNETHLKTSSALQSANIYSVAWRVGATVISGN
ncbi:uncharacterized protein LOC110764462 isoform X1 [Prunus avium]|uniref:Uncharacterized protein LOC110764462 isoform X1 n=1 Tax=Prunus avium TaxID=42229 RepID=A0A6P5T7F2_PRUAV|nr:uncharacterized protein LOC110764462 isoform X1 [Prunus avium]